MNFCKGLP